MEIYPDDLKKIGVQSVVEKNKTTERVLGFPGDRLAELMGVNERMRRSFKAIAEMKHKVHEKASKTEHDLYHSEEGHTDVVMETVISVGEQIKYLDELGREIVATNGARFVRMMTSAEGRDVTVTKLYQKDNPELPIEYLEQTRQGITLDSGCFGENEQGVLNDDDTVLMYLALAFHDSGRFNLLDEEDLERGVRKTKGHEDRSIQTLREVFQSDEFKEQREILAKEYPQLFGETVLADTLNRASYLIHWTKYVRQSDEDTQVYERTIGKDDGSMAYLKDREKMNFLGALTLEIDIGVMQLKYGSFEAMRGLIYEYLADAVQTKDTKIFASVKWWVERWTTISVLPFAADVLRLMENGDYLPSLMDKSGLVTKVDPRFVDGKIIDAEVAKTDPRSSIEESILMRKELVAYIESQGVDIDQKLTWGELLKYVEQFMELKNKEKIK